MAKQMPKHGDVAVFRLPADPKTYYIKRIIGLPGDTVQVLDEIVFVNGKPLKKTRTGIYSYDDSEFRLYEETTQMGKKYEVMELVRNREGIDYTAEFKVPQGHYFVMGDNRDRSADCRTSSIKEPFVPLDHFVGRAEVVMFSIDFKLDNWSLKKPFGIRFDRFFKKII